MIKNILFAAALVTLVLATGCAKGGSGPCLSNCPGITVSGASGAISPVSQAPISTTSTPVQITFTATPLNATLSSVNWTLTGTSCSSNAQDPSNPCGYFTSASTSTTITYQSPTSVPSDPGVTVTATSGTNSSLSGADDITIVDITTAITPVSPDVQFGLSQQFTAVAVPDNAPQSFNWTCMASGVDCNSTTTTFTSNGDVATYTPAPSQKCSSGNSCIQIYANATNDPSQCPSNSNCVIAQPALVASRVNGTYAFRFAGYDGSGNPVNAAGTFTAASGSISGVEVVATTSGAASQNSFSGGQYAPTSGTDNNSGTLTLSSGAPGYPYSFHVGLDGAGDMQMIEADGNGTGSGVAEPSAKIPFSQQAGQSLPFVFGFTGVDSGGKRVGYAGLLPMVSATNCSSGSAYCGTIANGMLDINDFGMSSVSNLCSSPCAVTGSYSSSASVGGLWNLSLTTAAGATLDFDFFIANGSASANTLTLYAVSTDAISSTSPIVGGRMAIQNSNLVYNNKAFNGTSVSALTGVDKGSSVVSLTLGTTDGTDSGTGGTGNFTGQFDQNDAGTVLIYPNSKQSNFGYTYVADSSNNGRYTFQMLGNPGASPVVPPLPFILYASGANRGFLLECNTSSCNNTDAEVMTGTMVPQSIKNQYAFVPAGITGTYAVATNSNSLSNDGSCTVLGNCNATMNLLLTSPGNNVFNVTGTVNPSGATANWNYTVQTQGTGNIVPPSGAKTPNFAFYGVSGTEYYMIEEDSGVPSPVLHMQQ